MNSDRFGKKQKIPIASVDYRYQKSGFSQPTFLVSRKLLIGEGFQGFAEIGTNPAL
jgi:hypothetical protein